MSLSPSKVPAPAARAQLTIPILLGLLLLVSLGAARADEAVRGADVGWLQQMEATGFVFRNDAGTPADCLRTLQDHGVNTIRLRVFVNPTDDPRSGHCSPTEVVAMATRVHKMGFRLLIDFHYSDTWADPGKQGKPAAWKDHDLPRLGQDVYDHTFSVLKTLAAAGVTPEWVQVGNEITGGLLWPEGSTKNWPNVAALLNRGYDAVKAVNPAIKVIIHLDHGERAEQFQWWFDAYEQNGGKFDVVGLSYYPFWIKKDYAATIEQLGANLKAVAARYGKEVMVVEVGNEDTAFANTRDMLLAVRRKLREVPGGKGVGFVYWEPEGARAWSHYELSCWQADGRPTAALEAFRGRRGGRENIRPASGSGSSNPGAWASRPHPN